MTIVLCMQRPGNNVERNQVDRRTLPSFLLVGNPSKNPPPRIGCSRTGDDIGFGRDVRSSERPRSTVLFPLLYSFLRRRGSKKPRNTYQIRLTLDPPTVRAYKRRGNRSDGYLERYKIFYPNGLQKRTRISENLLRNKKLIRTMNLL